MTRKEIVSFNTRLPKDLKDRIKLLAVTEDKSIQDLVCELLIVGLEEYTKKQK